MIGSRFIALWLISLAVLACAASIALAQSTDTVYDQADVLTSAQEQRVQQAFDSAEQESGQPLYAFLVPNTGVDAPQDRRDLLTREASDASVPQDAGVVVVATNDGWGKTHDFPQDAYDAMVPDFREGDFASGLIAGADEIRGQPVAAQDNSGDGAGVLPLGGLILLLLVGGAGTVALLRNRRTRRRSVEEQRRIAEEEFAGLTTSLDEFDEKERLVSGYLEAQRPLLDQRTEEWVETRISDAKTAGFAQEFNAAASGLVSDPFQARERMERGRGFLEEAMRNLDEAERTMDDYRSAEKALDGRLREALREILASEVAEKTARAEGVAVDHQELRPEYERLALEAAHRASHRGEFDPRESLGAVEALAQQASEHEQAVRDGISARDALPDERHAAEGALARARTSLGEYRWSYEKALGEFGQAALGEVPNTGELSSGLLEAEGHVERADRAASARRFAEALTLLRRATAVAREDMQAPSQLKAAVAEADRKKREGEEKLEELEARLAEAKANEHFMGPSQRQRLREYEYQLQNARYGFFGGDWLTAILIFEALDNDYMSMGDPSSFDAGDWGGGDWGDGGFGGGDFGGGDF